MCCFCGECRSEVFSDRCSDPESAEVAVLILCQPCNSVLGGTLGLARKAFRFLSFMVHLHRNRRMYVQHARADVVGFGVVIQLSHCRKLFSHAKGIRNLSCPMSVVHLRARAGRIGDRGAGRGVSFCRQLCRSSRNWYAKCQVLQRPDIRRAITRGQL